MALEKKLIFNHDARKVILRGIMKCGKAVMSTFGPRGKLSVVWKGTIPYTTRDGAKTIQVITFKDELENIGAALMKEASLKANKQNGDGSTTVALLTAALCNNAQVLINRGADVNDVTAGYRIALEDTIDEIKKMNIPVSGPEDLKKVALVSAHGDDEIADVVVRAFTGIGENGVVIVSDSLSRKGKSDVVFNTGCELERGFMSSLCVNTKSDTCELKDVRYLLSSKPIKEYEEITPFVHYCMEKQYSIVIIAPDYEESAVAGFNGNLSKKSISGAQVLAPGTSKQDVQDRLRDLAVILNAKILHEDIDPDDFKFDTDFGRSEECIIHAMKTEIIEPATDEKKMEEYTEELKAKINKDDIEEAYSEFEIEKIKERLAHMSGGVACIKVGAITQMELDEKKDRYDDAVNAVRAVLQQGMIPGGGTSLLWAALNLENSPDLKQLPDGIQAAYIKFLEAIQWPINCLARSCGRTPESVIRLLISKGEGYVFDARRAELTTVKESGILDSMKVIINDLMYSENVAETFMSIDVAIISDLTNITIEHVDPVLQEDFFGSM